MTELFERHRRRLRDIAYRMLGSPEDADDVVQEAYLRWYADDRGDVRDPEGWLVAVTTRLAIDRLRSARRERERYPGPWLPVPLTASLEPPPDRAVEVDSELSLAFLHLLERLQPEERAAFLLRRAFDVDYAGIAHILGRSEAACRQIVSRARRRLQEGPHRARATPDEVRDLAERFHRALESGSREEVVALLAPDATHHTDGGGKGWAALRPIRGDDAVARGILGALEKGRRHWRLTAIVAEVNGEAAIIRYADGKLASVTTFLVQNGVIGSVYTLINPEKLAGLGSELDPPTAGGSFNLSVV